MKMQPGHGLLGKNRRSGQALVEYALILSLISLIAMTALRGVGVSVNNKLAQINSNLQ